MLNNWEDFNKISRSIYEEKEYTPPPGMFRSIQKKLFWSNCRLFLKAYTLHITMITICAITIPLVLFLIAKPSARPRFNITKTDNYVNQKDAVVNQNEYIHPGKNILKEIPVNSQPGKNNYQETENILQPIAGNVSSPNKNKVKTERSLIMHTESNKFSEKSPDINDENILPEDITKNTNNVKNDIDNEERKFLTPVSHDFFRQIPAIPYDETRLFSKKMASFKNDYYSKNQPLDYNLKVYGTAALATGVRNDAPEVNNSESTALKMASSFTFSGTAGFAFDMKIKQLHFQIGVQYTQLQLNYTADNLLYNSHIDTQITVSGYHPQITELNYYHYSYRLDSVIHTLDSIYTTEYDTIYLPDYVTTRWQHYDSLKRAEWKETFHIIEIPISLGYSFNYKAIDFSVNGGLILGYITGTKYHTYAGRESVLSYVPVKSFYSYKSLQLSWIVSLSGTYWLGRHTGIEISPYYRRSIINLDSKDKRTSIKYSMTGINLGLIYKF